MEIKLRANIVMSKELTIEANDWVEAVEKARTMMTRGTQILTSVLPAHT